MPLTHAMATPCRARAERGMSLVELMVGIAIGLFIVAAASMLVSTQLGDNRRLLLETQLHQDLRAAADIITRQLRRAGHWQASQAAVGTLATPATRNPHAAVQPASGAAAQVDIAYNSPTGETGPFGFKWEGNVLRTFLAGAGPQDLTDANTLRITAFSVTPRDGPALRVPCPKLCADGSGDCWPTLTVRELVVDITGQAVADPAVQRRLRTVVRLRNDWIRFNIAGQPNQACPV